MSTHVLPQNRITASLVFLVGASCMIVAGYFLIEGLSQFSGDETTRNILIIGGILFQITESLCFIAAASLAFHSITWRMSLFGLGCVLFLFSIAVMTLAQKTALQTGINEASAIDEKREQIREQIASLDRMIESYRYNAEKQSKSIYKDSRAMGQDSINRAAEIEGEKSKLSEQLFALNQQRKETSIDFFIRLEEVTGLPAVSTEFYFLVIRSLLLELCGIILMAFAANLRALISQHHHQQPVEKTVVASAKADRNERNERSKKPGAEKAGRKTKAQSAKRKEAVDNSVVTTLRKPKEGLLSLVSSISKPLAAKLKEANKEEINAEKNKLANSTALKSAANAKQASVAVAGGAVAANHAVNADSYDIDNIDLDAEIAQVERTNNIHNLTQHDYSRYIDRLRQNEEMSKAEKEIAAMGASLMELYQRGIITTLSREGIIRGLAKHHNINIDSAKAKEIKQFLLAENDF